MPKTVSKTVFEIEEQQTKEQHQLDTSIRHGDGWIALLCVSHAAAAWGERSWEFGAGLLLLQINNDSEERLRLTALLVLAECTACSLLGPRIGRAVDRTSFLGSAVLTLGIQNIAIATAAGFLLWAFDRQDNLLLAGGAIAFSVVARLASVGSTITVEKRWVTALSQHTKHCYGRLDSQEDVNGGSITADEEERSDTVGDETVEADGIHVKEDSPVLSQVNARLRCIDLTCNLCAPIAVGFLLESISPEGAAISIAAFNALAWPVEVLCLVWIHRRYRDVLSTKEVSLNETKRDQDSHEMTPSLCEAWILYHRQTIFRSALALAVLYFSVVGFGTLMTAWLAASGFHAGHLGAARAVAALSGMLSTATTPRIVPGLGVETAGLRYIWFMWLCILPCTLAAFYASINANFLWIIIVSVIVSRFGLWGFDLCVTQLLQERIEPLEKIGEVNGVQVALQNAFDALAALSCVILPNPDTFCYLILGSFGSVTIAALLHTSLWRSNV